MQGRLHEVPWCGLTGRIKEVEPERPELGYLSISVVLIGFAVLFRKVPVKLFGVWNSAFHEQEEMVTNEFVVFNNRNK